MARKTAEDAALDSSIMAAERSVEQIASSAQVHAQTIEAMRAKNTRMQVISNGEIPEVEFQMQPLDGNLDTNRMPINLITQAPVVADATKIKIRRVIPPPEGEEAREEKFFVVMETKGVLDSTSGHRTPIHAGKIISDKHYNVANLLRQGVKLKRTQTPSVATDDAFIDEMTR